ncbi:UDP-N-acetylmuramoyl-L-alanine--D-glutamate ligase [Brunnivagina elsteri]|uniref:UDP-N-acetylmuramoylalanine--D-glutamate ligase n=1 Tax=Brunnivagina elsteri CCALA 953 TaxID=987040 RepID=A0A2A2TMN0_9CYAN|nr:UDP-N-acetylmuramoyl-L-alanine--D-glutamate ligase [Calothrix elsteri]PAX59713.1 UDP-N-acetylmuramoyl-L-alanine--D-glutamate ligase [Calothrix elsteri CCALA 953]
MSKAHVIGFGKSGVAAARLLKREGWEVEIGDNNTSPNLLVQQQELAAENITVKLGYTLELEGSHLASLPKLIVVSPGVPWDIPQLVKARELGIETIGEMEFAWRNLSTVPWIGITGTNGKTTTTALTAAIFQAAGLNAIACGNIGYAATEVALEFGGINYPSSNKNPLDWVIGEISSYQIESSSTFSPRIGIWTTFTPDHLARHKTLDNYYNIKAQLLRRSEFQVFNGDDVYLRKIGTSEWSNAYWTSVNGKEGLLSEKGFYIEDGWVVEKITASSAPLRIVKAEALRMVGVHNLQNLLVSVAAARLAGIEPEAIIRGVSEFSGVAHRLEYICTWEGIDFINDSKATNYDAAEVGLASVKSPVVLIAGGEAKEGDDTAWLGKIKEKAAAVVLIGNAASFFSKRLQEVGYTNFEDAGTMEKAIPRAAELAKKYAASVILLSPACASFDQYPNFEIRGDDFRKVSLEFVGK